MNMMEISFGYQLDNLKNLIEDNYSCKSPESGFAEYIFLNSGNELLSVTENHIFNIFNQQRFYQAPILAAIGYKIASNIEELDRDLLALWKNGFSRLATKNIFTPDRTSFFYRPVELLGISLGAINCPEVSNKNLDWLKSILQKGESKLDVNDYWVYFLGNVAASSLDVIWTQKSQLLPKEMKIEELALLKFLCNFNIFIPQAQEIKAMEDKVNEILLERCLFEPEMPRDIARAAIIYCSLKQIVTQVLRSSCHRYYEVANNSEAAIEFIDCISDRFSLATKQLKSQDEINLSKEKLKNISKKLLAIESDARKALEVVNNIIEQKTSDLVINNQEILFIGNNINMSEYNLQNSKFGGGFAAEGSVQSGGALNDYSIIIAQNIDDINHIISSLREAIQHFPNEQKEDAEMELNDLEEEIINPEKQDPKRLGRRLKRLAAVGTAVATLAGGAVSISEDINKFTNNVMELGEKLEVPFEFTKARLDD